MGAFEQKVRDVIEELAAGDMAEQAVDEIINALCDVFGLWAYGQLVTAREESNKNSRTLDAGAFGEARGRVIILQEIWQKIIFDGESVQDGGVTQEQLVEAERYWTGRLKAAIAASGITM